MTGNIRRKIQKPSIHSTPFSPGLYCGEIKSIVVRPVQEGIKIKILKDISVLQRREVQIEICIPEILKAQPCVIRITVDGL